MTHFPTSIRVALIAATLAVAGPAVAQAGETAGEIIVMEFSTAKNPSSPN